jgi:inositol phosphorylceramide mannosyltransferase catalytic subunit
MAIPKLIHQTTKNKSQLPEFIRTNIDFLKRTNPGWRYNIYDDFDCEEFIAENYSDRHLFLYKMINPKYGAARADFFRYLLMFKVGGVYLDIKSTCIAPLDDVLIPDDEFILSHWSKSHPGFGRHPGLGASGEFQQWHIICAPKHPLMMSIMNDIANNIEQYDALRDGYGKNGVMKVTGPLAYSKAINKVLGAHKHRVVDVEELGFRYSLLEKEDHKGIFEMHYSDVYEPLVRPDHKRPRSYRAKDLLNLLFYKRPHLYKTCYKLRRSIEKRINTKFEQ